MKKSIFTAAFAALLLALTSCSSKDSPSSEVSSTEGTSLTETSLTETETTEEVSAENVSRNEDNSEAITGTAAETETAQPASYPAAAPAPEGSTSYDLSNFSFTASNDLVPDSPTDGKPLKISFQSSSITNMSVEGYASRYEDISYCGESLYQDILDWEGTSDVTYELVDVNGFKAAEINYKRDPGDGLTGYSDYIAVCEGMEFRIFAFYPAENAGQAIPVIKSIMESAVYTSDYRLPTGQQHVENDVYSLDFGPEWVMRAESKSEKKLKDDGLEFSHMFTPAKASNAAESACLLTIEGGPMKGVSAAEKANSTYQVLSENDRIYELERSSSELLDNTAEEVSYRLGSGSTAVNVTDRYIDLDGRLLKIHTFSSAYENNDDIIRRLNELIGAIELK